MAPTTEPLRPPEAAGAVKKRQGAVEGDAIGNGNGNGIDHQEQFGPDEKTDYSRWRLVDEDGRQTWVYLKTEEEVRDWPQSVAEKYHLGMPTNLPELPEATTPLAAANNGLTFFSHLQLEPGNWACEYGGPLFLLPGIVITWYVTGTPIARERRVEIRRYLFARQNPADGGWGLHIEGHSSVFGTALNYVVLRILGADAEDPRMVRARTLLHAMGGATHAPLWGKFWLCVLGCMDWGCFNPVPPELWLLPDWVPVHPWRWWVHNRMVELPMGFIWSKRFSHPVDDLTAQLRRELYTEPYEQIDFARHRTSIAKEDNYHPKSLLLRVLFWIIVNVYCVYFRFAALVRWAEDWSWQLIKMEDENTDYACLGPVNAPMNTVATFIQEGRDSKAFQRHIYRLDDYLWVKDEGMLANGTNGVQVWDTAFVVQALDVAGFAGSKKWRPLLARAQGFLDRHQLREEVPNRAKCYRHRRKGAWPFSTRTQGYTVSDCTAEGLRAALQLQNVHGFPALISESRLRDAVDTLLSMQNASGGFTEYELTRGPRCTELLNAAEVFGNIMIGYDYPECTTSVLTTLHFFTKFYPDYRAREIERVKARAADYIRRAQRPDGSWYGSWGICFTYAAMFALESLATVGETYATSRSVRLGCQFLIDRQMPDGGWGESYLSSATRQYVAHERSQVVQTAWAALALMEAGYPDQLPLKRAMALLMRRQQRNGEWLQEAIEGVFNQSCMISYPNYKFYWPIRALGLYSRIYGNEEIDTREEEHVQFI
ncbi:Lanosterol synthase (Oxidosqualene--lanosterol cyclase) [Ascosphaera acerosa]|nr:Lanosterol synthase (Oxidosqualene--lanosterol cyclase) [Ascosphaera acerosa]